MLETYFSTARSVITSRSAIPWLELPVAISSSTSRSRGVSRSSGSLGRCLERSVDTIFGSIAEPPSATRRTAPDEFLDVADPVLQQVSHPVRRVSEQLHREPELDVLRQHEHSDRGVAGADLERRAQALVLVRRRQADVDDHRVDRVTVHLQQELVGAPAAGDDLEAGIAEEPGEPLAEQDAVLGDRYAHGISALTRVPPPRGVQILISPPSASTRSARPRRPEPRSVSAPPTPSSLTSTTSWPFLRARSTVAEVACACFAMLARLSQTT
jgi:hypothetical protein